MYHQSLKPNKKTFNGDHSLKFRYLKYFCSQSRYRRIIVSQLALHHLLSLNWLCDLSLHTHMMPGWKQWQQNQTSTCTCCYHSSAWSSLWPEKEDIKFDRVTKKPCNGWCPLLHHLSKDFTGWRTGRNLYIMHLNLGRQVEAKKMHFLHTKQIQLPKLVFYISSLSFSTSEVCWSSVWIIVHYNNGWYY